MEDTKVQLNYSASAVSVDCKGKYAVLGARRGLCVISLDRSWDKKFLYHNKMCEVGTVQFNPHQSKCSYIANTVSDTIQVWDIASKNSQVTSFKGHNSAITGLVWSPADDNMLGTCSTDSYLKLWDTRDTSKPVRSFCAFTSIPSQLRWNPLSSHILASAHDGEVRIWDTRKTDTYVSFITAHFSSISSLDWSPKRSEQLVTCAQDRQIKVWDVNMPLEFKIKGLTAKPVWKIRYTPFGEGLVTVSAKNDHQIRLWSLTNDDLINIHVFNGHTDVIKSFDFRNRGGRTRSSSITSNSSLSSSTSMEFASDYQLVTWSKDQTLRLWTLNQQMQEDCGHFVNDNSIDQSLRGTPDVDGRYPGNYSMTSASGVSVNSNSSITSTISNSIRGWIRKNKSALNTEIDENMTYSQECTKVANELEQVTLEETNAVNRSCTFRIDCPKSVVRLRVSFPSVYPRGAVPMFEFPPTKSSLSIQDMKKLKEKLNQTAEEYCLHQNRLCMAACMNNVLELIYTMDLTENKPQTAVDDAAPKENKPISARGMRHQITQDETGDDEISALLKKNARSTNDNTPTQTPVRRKSRVITDDRRVPSPVTCFGLFSPSGQFIYVNSFSTRDFSSAPSHDNSEREDSAEIKQSKGLSMRTYDDWKRRMFRSRRKRAELEQESPTAFDRQSRSSVNSQDYFQNFFSGYSSKELRTSSPGMESGHDDTMNESQKTVADENDDLDSSSPLDGGLDEHAVSNSSLQQHLQIHAAKRRKQQDEAPSIQVSRRSNRSKNLDLRIHIYNIIDISASPISIDLAKDYVVLGNDAKDICVSCRRACLKHNKPDLAKVWSIVEHIVEEAMCTTNSHSISWSSHPLVRNFISRIFTHYLRLRDVQTLAVLSCVLSLPSIHSSLLDPSQDTLYNHLRLFYADLLHRWGYDCQRNEIMKFVAKDVIPPSERMLHDCAIELVRGADDQNISLGLSSEEFMDDNERPENTEQDEDTPRRAVHKIMGMPLSSPRPSRPLFKCSLCRLPVKGLYTLCPKCGHGGHVDHMKSWFGQSNCCASGCGCNCIAHMESYPFTVSKSLVEEEGTPTDESDLEQEENRGHLTPPYMSPISPQDMVEGSVVLKPNMFNMNLPEKAIDDDAVVAGDLKRFLQPAKTQTLPLQQTQASNLRTPSKSTKVFKFRTFDYNQGYF